MAFENEIYQNYKDIISEAYKLYNNKEDAYKRVLYVKDKAPKEVYNMFLVETVQWEYFDLGDEIIELTAEDLEYICRSFGLALANMESNTEEGQFKYMLRNHEDIFLKLLRNLMKQS